MNLKTIDRDSQVNLKGVRVIFERENDVLTRIFLMSQAGGETYVIKLGSACLEALRREPDHLGARVLEPDDGAALPAA